MILQFRMSSTPVGRHGVRERYELFDVVMASSCLLLRKPAPISGQRVPGHKARFIRTKPQHCARNFFGLSDSSNVLKLACAVWGVHRHYHYARQTGAEFEQKPFGDIGRPYCDVLTGFEAGEQRLRRALRITQEFGERPCPPFPGLETPGDKSSAVGRHRC
jgi:hypothetical protein